MKHVLHILGSVALLAVAWLAGESALTIRYARQRSVYTFDQLNKVLRETSQTLDEVRKGATTWQLASKTQVDNSNKILVQVGATVRTLNATFAGFNESVNKSLVPSVQKALEEENSSLLESQRLLQENLAQSQKVLADADAQINSPDIKIAMDNFAASSANLATATKEGAASMTDIHSALDYEIKQLEAPVTKLKAAGMIALTVIRKLYF